MASRWLLTVRRDCDLKALADALKNQGVELDERQPVPMGEDEQAVTVSVEGKLPDGVRRLPEVVRVHPASKLKLF